MSFAQCCRPYHARERAAPTAEALMRSRYAAFVLQDAAYLSATWHSDTRPAMIDFTPGQQWLQLRVLGSSSDGEAATVEFVARSRIGGSTHVLHETSRFARKDGRWFYLDGVLK